jgi:hypothetical protein
MARTSGTYAATAVTARQWVGIRLATWAVGYTLLFAFAFSIWLLMQIFSSGGSTRSELELFFLAWSYVHDGSRIGFAYPPITLWLGLVTFVFATGHFTVTSRTAIRAAKAGLRTRRQRLFSRSEARSDRDAEENLTRQLHEWGYAGLFVHGRQNVWLGFMVAGVGLVLVTALLAPTSVTNAGQTVDDTQKGLLPMVCLVSSLIAFVGLLLTFPYGPREKVVVDVLGNVRGADELVVPPEEPPLAQTPAQPERREAGRRGARRRRPAGVPGHRVRPSVLVSAPQPAAAEAREQVLAGPPGVRPGAGTGWTTADASPTTAQEPAIAPTSGISPSPQPVSPPVSPLASTAPTIAFCPRCGTRRISDARFCSGCGAAFEDIARP